MFHNTLFRLERNQKKWLFWLGLTFLVFSIVWFFAETFDWPFPMEPIVVFFGGIATLLASYWPWKPGYVNKRKKGRNVCDYKSNNGEFSIGCGDLEFTLNFTKSDGQSIHLYSEPENIKKIAIAHGAGQISDVKDVTSFNYSNQYVCPQEGQIVCLQNVHGNYAIVHIHDVKDSTRNDDRDEVTFSYIINPDGGTDFS